MKEAIKTIVVAKGDGIGPEIMDSVLKVLKAAGARLNYEFIEIGEKLYRQGISTGISREAWDAIKKHNVLLKAPITTPQGNGYKSLNVTFRKVLGLFANVRPVVSFQPFIAGHNEKIDMVIIRENEEDLYAGIEYRSTENSYLSLKLVSKAGCEKIIRYAFEYARVNKRSKVTCIIKDNIMKITDGLFHKTFKEIAKEYKSIATDSYIVDIGAAMIASKPQLFDVIVTLNLYGDILSDIAAEVSGSIGLAGSFNIGKDYAMFEAVHGSAPDIAGKNIANPSGLLNAAILMLNHIGQQNIAVNIQNALLKTIEEGMHTADTFNIKSKKKLSTQEFTDLVIKNLGAKPSKLKAAEAKSAEKVNMNFEVISTPVNKNMVGVDVYLMDQPKSIQDIAQMFQSNIAQLKLTSIAQRGLLIWPTAEAEENSSSMIRLRFLADDKVKLSMSDIKELISFIISNKLEIALLHTLYNYDGIYGFSKAQGE